MSTLLQSGRILQQLLFQVEQSFEDSLEIEDSLRARLEDGGARFHMWAVNLGLFDDGHASLDYRLQNAEDAREYVAGLLDEMKGYLEEMLEILSSDQLPNEQPLPATSPDEQEGELDSINLRSSDISVVADEMMDSDLDGSASISLLLSAVDDILRRMFKAAASIRNPATRSEQGRRDVYSTIEAQYRKVTVERLVQIETNRIADSISQWRRDLTDENFDDKQKTNLSEEDLKLIKRLGIANNYRRQQFFWWSKRQRRSLASAVPQPSAQIAESATKPGPERHHNTQIQAANNVIEPSMPSSATKIRSDQIDLSDRKSVTSNVTRTPSARGLSGEKVTWPLAPGGLSKGPLFTCPYCFTLCPDRYRSARGWRAHLIHDLRPYICTYLDCTGGSKTYSTWHEWHSHEALVHNRAWRCLEHSSDEFSTREKYISHIEQHHTKRLSELCTPEMVASRMGAASFSNRLCPFCLAEEHNADLMQQHVAFHLETLALYSLPRSTGLEQSSEQGEIESGASGMANNESRAGDWAEGSLRDDWADGALSKIDEDQDLPFSAKPNTAGLNGDSLASLSQLEKPDTSRWLIQVQDQDGVDEALIAAFKEGYSSVTAEAHRYRRDKAMFGRLRTVLMEGEQEIQKALDRGIGQFGPEFMKDETEDEFALQKIAAQMQSAVLQYSSAILHGDLVQLSESLTDTCTKSRVKALNIITTSYMRKERATTEFHFEPPKFPLEFGEDSVFAKLKVLSDALFFDWIPRCEDYIQNPPSDPRKRDQQCKVLTEGILSFVLVKLDNVDVEGNATARRIRKELIEQAYEAMRRCDKNSVRGSFDGYSGGRSSPYPSGIPRENMLDHVEYLTSDLIDDHHIYDKPPDPEDAPDVVILKSRGQEYKLNFAPFAISDGKVLVGDLRKYARQWLNTDAWRLRLLYEREPLEDDSKPATYYGVKQKSTVSCVLTEGNASVIDSSSNDVDSVSTDRRQRQP